MMHGCVTKLKAVRNMDVEKLERVHKRATKLISEISKKPYIELLQVLSLPH